MTLGEPIPDPRNPVDHPTDNPGGPGFDPNLVGGVGAPSLEDNESGIPPEPEPDIPPPASAPPASEGGEGAGEQEVASGA